MGRVLMVFLAAGLLVACEASVRGPTAEIKLPTLRAYDGPGFCPPGQAKKGNC